MGRLSADLAIPAALIGRSLTQIENALQAVVERSSWESIGNPFTRAPLSAFSAVNDRIVGGAIRIRIT